MKIVAAIQARLGSSRLPQKALRPLCGSPIFENIVRQLKAAASVGRIVLTTSDSPEEGPLIQLAGRLGVSAFTAPVDDIVARLWIPARNTKADLLVRVWGDCPFICPDVVDAMAAFCADGRYEFCTNSPVDGAGFPGGLDLEIYTGPFLRRMFNDVKDPKLREYPVEYVKCSSARWGVYRGAKPLPEPHLTIDYPEDLSAAERLYTILAAKGRAFTYSDLHALLTARPELWQSFSTQARNIEYNRYLKTRNLPR